MRVFRFRLRFLSDLRFLSRLRMCRPTKLLVAHEKPRVGVSWRRRYTNIFLNWKWGNPKILKTSDGRFGSFRSTWNDAYFPSWTRLFFSLTSQVGYNIPPILILKLWPILTEYYRQHHWSIILGRIQCQFRHLPTILCIFYLSFNLQFHAKQRSLSGQHNWQ